MADRAFSLCRRSSLLSVLLTTVLLPTPALAAQNLGALATPPRWGVLEHYQETITREEFANLVQNVYCTHGIPPDTLSIDIDSARILMDRQSQRFFTLRFARNDTAAKQVPRLWRRPTELGRASSNTPLLGQR